MRGLLRTVILPLTLYCLMILPVPAQIRLTGYQQAHINPELFQRAWAAHWISVPHAPDNAYGVYHFRKSFDLANRPEHFYVHVSADNRYKLFVNGKLVSLGPARSDPYNWNFETVDLAPHLKKGKNVLATVVWNFAEYKPVPQMSFNHTGFLLQGDAAAEQLVNTDTSWRCLSNAAYTPWQKPVYGYYVAGPGDNLNAQPYPWGWQQPSFNDQAWVPARQGMSAATKGHRDYPNRLLVPSPIPPMEMATERLARIRLSEGMEKPASGFLKGTKSLTIPAHSKVRLLLDNEQLTTGYLSLQFSRGKNAEIRIGYSEALYSDSLTHAKGHRDQIEGKFFVGYEDRIQADGGSNRDFTSLWWRTYRYVNLLIATADEPLVLEDLFGTSSRYPLQQETTFSVPERKDLQQMLDIGWRTARLCANETYMDCPYYEQLQYFGDTRIQALITLYNTRDPWLVKNALEQGRQSMVADGLTMSRYPSNLHQFISSFSLLWIGMGYDYYRYRDDAAYLKTLLPAHRQILSWYEQWLKPDYSLGYVPNWFFADWAGSFDYGEPPREKDGDSAFQDLLYLMSLQMAAELEQNLGLPALAQHYQTLQTNLKKAIYQHYWNPEKGLLADTKTQRSYSQHVNALAVLAGVVEADQAKQVMQTVLSDRSLTQTTIYFRYYVNQALSKAGLGDLLLDHLQLWQEQMKLGLTTWAEMPEPSRSDCHAWGSSPNIEFYRIVLGIDSEAAGFKKIRIAPALGTLKEASGSMPHPAGTIKTQYTLNAQGKLTARITLPLTTSGTFHWKGKTYPLQEGSQVLSL